MDYYSGELQTSLSKTFYQLVLSSIAEDSCMHIKLKCFLAFLLKVWREKWQIRLRKK